MCLIYKNLPTFARLFLTEQPNRRMVHLLSYIPENRGNTPMIEEGIELYNIEIMIRNDEKKYKKVYVAPEKTELPFEVVNGYTKTVVPKSKGYSLIVFEE